VFEVLDLTKLLMRLAFHGALALLLERFPDI